MNFTIRVAAAVTQLIRVYISRVKGSGGTVKNQPLSQKLLALYKSWGILSKVPIILLPEAGSIINTSGGNFFAKLFGLVGTNDATQSTALNQPYVGGIVAPGDKLALVVPLGDLRYMLNTSLALASTDKWSFTACINWSGRKGVTTNRSVMAGKLTPGAYIGLETSGGAMFRFYNGTTAYDFTGFVTTKIAGKTSVIALTYDGAGVLSAYLNGVLIATQTGVVGNIEFATAMIGYGVGANYQFEGKMYYYSPKQACLSASQVNAEAALLLSAYTDPSVTIGSQAWAVSNMDVVSTPMGVSIANVTDNTAWTTAQTLYTNAYAAQSGTTAQKNYAGLQAAAMWCYGNNTTSIGAVYGKIYNWFALALWEADRITYDAANPSAPWGWRMPTQADWTTLQSTLGGSTVAGGHLKVVGTNYWTTPNTGADNSTGFSALPGGYRSGGVYSSLNIQCIMSSLTEYTTDPTQFWFVYINNNSAALTLSILPKTTGMSARLIKN